MQTFFYNLSGGINTSESKISLGLNTKRLYWTDAENIETLQGNGIVRQNGNILLTRLEEDEKIITIHKMPDEKSNILIATSLGNLYLYNNNTNTYQKIDKEISGTSKLNIIDFLDGVVLGSKEDSPFYINNDSDYLVESCNFTDNNNNCSDIFCSYAGRLWVASGATLYFSALGKYNDFSTAGDAGFINNFHADMYPITGLAIYKEYLAIYKKDSVYLLSGTNETNFRITPFANKGTYSHTSIVNANNKQYFVSQGVFSLEQAGLLSQIQVGSEISTNIKSEFEKFDNTRLNEVIALNYENKNQIWFFIPYKDDNYFHIIWIYDYLLDAWYKRVLPQDITTATLVNEKIYTADKSGNIYLEDFGSTFNGKAIKFLWKTPFIASGNSNIRKTIEEFYFVLDENYDNNFNFSVYKDYDDTNESDEDTIFSSNSKNLIWASNNDDPERNCYWNSEEKDALWSIVAEAIYKTEISESNYSVQLCISGNKLKNSAAIVGLEFKEIYFDE
ncbi:MAG: hypothetical protein MJ229_02985 [bacterium]|nr:hypothetical protein [bacterium]